VVGCGREGLGAWLVLWVGGGGLWVGGRVCGRVGGWWLKWLTQLWFGWSFASLTTNGPPAHSRVLSQSMRRSLDVVLEQREALRTTALPGRKFQE
jgi:hypothetical protein